MADIDISGSAFMELSAEGDLAVFSAYMAGQALMVLTATAALTVKNRSLQGSATLVMTGLAALTVKNRGLQGNALMVMSGSGTIDRKQQLSGNAGITLTAAGGMGVAIPLAGDALMVLAATGWINTNRNGLGVCDVVREIYMVWGLEYPCKAPGWAREAAVTDLNQALQILWNRARDRNYWTRETITVTLQSGENSQQLDDNVQNVVGPARFVDTCTPLISTGSRSEIDQFLQLFLEGDASGGPQGYYIDRGKQTADDPARCTLYISPAADEDIDLLLDVVREAPRFSWDDVDACPRVPIPHKYVESLLLPVVRYLALIRNLSSLVTPEMREQITKDYQTASGLLEEADPLPGKSGDNHERSKEARA